MRLFCVFIIVLSSSGFAKAQITNPEHRQMNVAILLFDGVEIIDYTAPYEVLAGAGPVRSGGVRPFKVFTVSEKTSIKTFGAMSVNPTYTFENVPPVDILIVPGGGGSTPGANGVGSQVNNPPVLKWVSETAARAELVMSVCNGAFILAQADLLNGLEATTTAGHNDLLERNFPKIKKVYRDKRFVDNGKIITTGGLTSGLDGAIHIIEKLYGRAQAGMVAVGLEYNWDPESKYSRANLADQKMPQSAYESFFENPTELVDWEGDTRHWVEVYKTFTKASPSEIIAKQNQIWDSEPQLKLPPTQKAKSAGEESTSRIVTDNSGKKWLMTITVEPYHTGQLIVTLTIDSRSIY